MIKDAFQYLNYFARLHTGAATPFPQVVYIEATKRCYMRCQMCDIWRMKEDGSTDLTVDQFRSFFDDCQQHRVRLVGIYGGEPLVRKDICEIVHEASKRGVPTSLTTAGPALTPHTAKGLGEGGLGVLNVSIDAPEPALHDHLRGREGTFNMAVRAIRLMQHFAPQTRLGINFTVMKVNYHLIPEMIQLADSLGVSSLKFCPIYTTWPQNATGNLNQKLLFTTADDTRELAAALKAAKPLMNASKLQFMSDTYIETIPYHHQEDNPHFNRCFAGGLTCEIQANGDVLSCLERPLLLGNIKQEKLSVLWRSARAAQIRRELKGCTKCQFCCYVEPALRYQPKFLLREPLTLWKDYKLYTQRGYAANASVTRSRTVTPLPIIPERAVGARSP